MDEERWAIVELMGHAKFAGSIRRGQLLEISVPESPSNPAFTKEVGWGAVFGITPCSESVARRAAEVIHRRGSSSMGRFAPSAAIPVQDPDALNLIDNPMEVVDLGAARTGVMVQEWKENQRLAAAAAHDNEEFPL
ncbi:MAG: hypothetical protein QME96_05850 [Myxococcota bacterium]|nr:hypothetical protein [Myxococcota bacterium]